MKNDKGVSFVGKRRSNGWLIGVFVALMVAIVGLGVAVIVNFVVNSEPEISGLSEADVMRNEAFDVASEINDRYNSDLNYTFNDAVADYEEQLSLGSKEYRALIGIYYARFLNDFGDDLDGAVEILNEIKEYLDESDYVLMMNYYAVLRDLYSGVDDEMYNYYNGLVEKAITANPDSGEEIQI